MAGRKEWSSVLIFNIFIVCVMQTCFGKEACNFDKNDLKLKCGVEILPGKEASVSFMLNKCANPITVDFNIKVDIVDFDWTHKLETERDIPIPGLKFSFAGVGVGFYVRAELYKEEDDVRLKLRIFAVLSASPAEFAVPPITVFDGKLPIDGDCSPVTRWWNGTTTGERVGFVVGIILFIIIVIVAITWCCYRKKDSKLGRRGFTPRINKASIFQKTFWSSMRRSKPYKPKKFSQPKKAVRSDDVVINMNTKDGNPPLNAWTIESNTQQKGVGRHIHDYEKKTTEASKTDVDKQLKAKKKRYRFLR